MKTINQFGRRLLALLLAVVMVVGQVPFGASAADETEEPAVAAAQQEELRVLVTRNEKASDATEATDASEETDASEDPSEVVTKYAYTLSVQTGDGTNWTDLAVDAYTADWGTVVDPSDTEEANAICAVTYKGRTLKVGAGADYTVWEVSSDFPAAITVADEHSVSEPTLAEGSELAADARWALNGGVAFNNDGKVTGTAADIGSVITAAVYDLMFEDEVVYTVTYTTTVQAATFDTVGLYDQAGNEVDTSAWYGADQTVTIKAAADSKYSDIAMFGAAGNGFIFGSTVDNTSYWVKEVTLTMAEPSVKVGDTELALNIDTAKPAISNYGAYRTSDENIWVYFDVSAASGIEQVEIFDASGAKLETLEEAGITGVEIATTTGEVTIKATNKVGNDASVTAAVSEKLSVSIGDVTGTKYDSSVANTVVLANGEKHTIDITISGASNVETDKLYLNPSNISVTDANGNNVDVTWTYDGAYKATVAVDSDLNGLKVSATDKQSRSASDTDTTTYVYDTKGPEIVVAVAAPTKTVNGVNYYKAEEVTYAVTVSDDYLTQGSYTIKYVVNGVEQTINGTSVSDTATFTVEDGQKLTSISVTATDAAGNPAQPYSDNTTVIVDNTAPVIQKAEITQGTVTKFYFKDSKYYAYMDPTVTNETTDSATLEITFTLDEANPNADELTKLGWTNENGVWTYKQSVEVEKDSTGVLELNVTAVDMLDQTPSADIVLTADPSDAGSDSYPTSVTMSAVNGVYEHSIYVDRRMPSTGAADEAPTIELVPVVTGDVQQVDNVFSGSFEYTLTVNDISVDGYDSGVDFENVKWTLNDTTFVQTELTTAVGNVFTIPVNVTGVGENNELKLTVEVPDKVGNTYTYIHTFGVDNKAPEITVDFDLAEDAAVNGYYNTPRTATVTVTDLNLNSTAADLLITAGENDPSPVVTVKETSDTKVVYEVVFAENGTYDLTASSTDKLGNSYTVPEADVAGPHPFKIYTTVPTVNLTMTSDSADVTYGDDHYYTDTVTVTAQMNDMELFVEDSSYGVLRYKLDGDTEVRTAQFDKTTGKATFKIEAEQALTYIELEVVNDAGTYANAVTGAYADWFTTDNNKVVYGENAHKVAVDGAAPQLTIVRTAPENTGYIQTKDGVDYFNGQVTYAITVTDKFLPEEEDAVQIKVNGGEVKAVRTFSDQFTGTDEVSYTFTVTDEKPLTDVTILVKDIVGKTAEINALTDEVADLSGAKENASVAFADSFAVESETVTYKGHDIVVDTMDPVVKAEISAVGDEGEAHEVSKFFVRDGKFYAYITPVEHSSNWLNWSAATESDTVTVTLKFSLTETNPDADRMPMADGENAGWSVDEDGNWTYVVTTVVEKEKAALIEFAVPVVDMADRIPTADVTLTAAGSGDEDEYPTAITLSPVTTLMQDTTYGAYVCSLYVDRATPVIGFEGDVELNPTVKPVTNVGGRDLFDGSFAFQLTIGDEDAGVKSVNWTLEGDAVGTYIEQTENEDGKVSDDGTYTIPVNIVEGAVDETEVVKLTITVTDNVDNVYTYIKEFSVDNKNPQVTVEKENLDGAKYIQTISYTNLLGGEKAVDYYDGQVRYTITASDLFMKDGKVTYVLNGKEKDVTLDATMDKNGIITYTGTITVDSNDTLSDITFGYNDYAEHHATRVDTQITDPDSLTDFADVEDQVQLSTNDVVVDMEAPEVSVTVESKDQNPTTGDGVTYYQSPVTYTVKVTDEFLTDMNVEGQIQKLDLSYTKENQDGVSVTLPTDQNGWSLSGNTYSYTITVEEGEVLTGIELEAYDNSNNPVESAPAQFEIKNNVVTYVGNTIVVDGTNAEVLVEKTVDGEYIQAFSGKDYYNGEVTYTVTVTDSFLTDVEETGSKILVDVTYLDGSKMETIDLLTGTGSEGLLSGEDKYTASFTVADGEAVKEIQIVVVDNAGNVTTAKNVTVVDEDQRTSFKTSNGAVVFSGLPFIVDMVKPTATLEVKGNVSRYYTNKDGVLFVQLDTVANAASGSLVDPANYQQIELILTVADKNLTLKDNEYPIVSNNADSSDSWSADISVNEDSTITYKKTITVKTDEVGVITMDMDVFDLAANPLIIDNIVYENLNNTIVEEAKHIFFSEDGKFSTKVSVDRRRPSSVEEYEAPVIQVTPADSTMKTTEGIDLYNGAFSFTLNVTDGVASENNSGIDYVEWTVKDEGVNPFVVSVEDINDAGQDVHKLENLTIPVALNGAGESNNVVLTITAVDNVGNVTTFQKQFAVDNLAPRIQVVYDNNDVRNEKYFKADRQATITITDINLDPQQYAVVNSTGVASGWTYDGTVGTCTYSFTAEGEHKFDMNCTDLATNHTADSAVEYTGEAVHEFILDKTKPVITVTFNPSAPSGRDSAGVNYYDQEQNVTVSVRDEYFDSRVTGSVSANMGANNTLSAFYQNGTLHTASTKYVEGNNYSFNVTVTDLAGNVSDTYNSEVFSVDLTSPTIVISSGNMTTEQLNIVQKDLVLAFTINDAQDNLSGHSVKVMHLNNEFEEVEVTGTEYYIVRDESSRTTVYVDFTNLEALKENDGIYTVQITAQDYAGHTVSLSPELVYSMNRLGSSFRTGDTFTEDFLEPNEDGTVYKNAVTNKLIIEEINPNQVWQDETKKVEGSVITIVVNGQTIVLEKDVDYTVSTEKKGDGTYTWYVYTYEIDPSNFMDNDELVDGDYTILFYGVDEAGNKNTNEADMHGGIQQNGEYSSKMTFTLDHKAPVISTYGIETDDIIDATSKKLYIKLSDNTPAGVKVLVDGVEVEVSESMEGLTDDQLWLALNEETGEYVLNIPESNEKRTVTIITTDAAGNVSEQVIENVLITSNWFIRAISNPVIVGGFCIGLLALILFIIIILKKKKKEEEEQPA